MTLSRFFGPTTPAKLIADLKLAQSVPIESFKKIVLKLESWQFSPGQPELGMIMEVMALAKSTDVPRETIIGLSRLYSTMASAILAVPQEVAFVDELTRIGLDKEHASILGSSLYSHRGVLLDQLRPSLKERFGPTLSRVAWRVDRPTAGSDPFISDPVVVLSLQLETPSETRDQRIELDRNSLDNLLEELSAARRELGRSAEKG